MTEDTRSVREVLRDIVGNLGHIIHAEFRLARLELREEASKVARASVFIAIGAIFATLACGLLLWSGVYFLARFMPFAAAAIAMAAAAALMGGGLIAAGVAQVRRVGLPSKTVASLREDIRWAKELNG
jgi:uncharacterized membrane protein YqjE